MILNWRVSRLDTPANTNQNNNKNKVFKNLQNKKLQKFSEKVRNRPSYVMLQSGNHRAYLKPIGWKNTRATKWAGFSASGLPIILYYVGKNGVNVDLIPLKTTHRTEEKDLAGQIKVVKNKNGQNLFLYEGEIYSKSELAKILVLPAQEATFMMCLDALPVSQEIYLEPNFYVDGEFIRFPQKFYASRSKPFQKTIVNNLKIGDIRPEILKEGFELLSKYPKQKTLFYAITGQLVVNLLSQFVGLNDYLITVESVGPKDTGKSFATDLALKINVGMSRDSALNDDALMTEFRHHSIMSSTNLYIYVEEARLKDKRMLKSLGKNIRGTKEQFIKIYDTTASLVLSLNSDVINPDPDEEEAINKRLAKFIFVKNDTVPKDIQDKGKVFLMKLQNEPGGLLFKILPQKTISEWVNLFLSIKGSSTAYRISKFGALIYGDNDFDPVITNDTENYVKADFESLIRLYWARIQDPRILRESESYGEKTVLLQTPIDLDKVRHGLEVDNDGNFKIRASLLREFLKELKMDMPLKTFATNFGYKYNTLFFLMVSRIQVFLAN